MSTPFRLVPEAKSVQTATIKTSIFPYYNVRTPFVLIADVDEVQTPYVDVSHTPYVDDAHTLDVQYVIHGDNGSALNVCLLSTAITLGYGPSDFRSSTQTVRAYDNTRREVMGTLEIEPMIGPTTFVTVFQVLRIPTSFNLLLGRPWIHRAETIPSSLHQKHGSTVVLKMMRSMFYLLDMRLGRRQHGPSEFMAIPDHDIPFGLGFIPTKADYKYMARLRKEWVRARLTHTPFDCPVRPYTMSLADYFLSDGAPVTSTSTLATPSSLDRMSLMTLYFLDEINEHETFVKIGDIVDGAMPHDEFTDEMLAISLSQVKEIFQLELPSPFFLFRVSIIEIVEEILTAPTPESTEDAIVVDDLFDGLVGLVEGAFDFVDPLLSFDVLSGFFSRSDNVHDSSFMDLSILEYLSVSCDITLYDMSGLDPSIVQHHLPLMPHVKLVKQKLRRLHPRWSLQVKEEIQKQLSVRFLSMVEYPKWMDNVVPVLKKDGKCQRAFERIREYLLSPPVLVPPTPGCPLLLYLSVSNRLRHYMTEYLVHLISRLNPLRYLFDRPALVSRLMKWLVLLTKFDIRYVTQKSIRGSIIADHLASLPVSDGRAIDDDFLDEDVATVTSLLGWHMYFDGATNHSGYGIGVLLIAPHGDHIPRSVRLAFSDRHLATNNIVEYEACILGLETTRELRIRQMEVFGDFNLRCPECQVHGDLIHVPPSELHALTSPWPFSVWGIDIIGKISPKSSNGHEFILVVIDYFTKWVEAASYARLTSSRIIKGLIRDPKGKFRRNWSGPYFIRELTPEGAAWLMDLDGNRFSEPTNVDQLKRYYV
uniref:Integrase catalytic domain-containing protein n=1 Tax=Vitis vinifera TaxID=29760 RepID=A5B9V3_VITVI|nr:hypothetical protein VITISV_033339 [Vitis vinifera]